MSDQATCTRVNVDKLICDSRYQRTCEEGRVARIVDNFDPKLLGTLELSARANGTYAVIDEQHVERLRRQSALGVLRRAKERAVGLSSNSLSVSALVADEMRKITGMRGTTGRKNMPEKLSKKRADELATV